MSGGDVAPRLENSRSLDGRLGSSKSNSDEFIECNIHYVDIFNYTCSGFSNNGDPCENILLPEVQLNNSGEFRIPACGDRILVRITRGGVRVYEKHISNIETVDDEGKPNFDFIKEPRNHQYARVPPLPGDYHKYSPGGGFFQMLRGGIMRFGVSPLCNFTMGKWENFWRLISQNWEFFSCGFNAYSLNKDGKVTTRFQWFKRDTWGLTFDKEWSKRGDFDLMVDQNNMGFYAGLVEEGVWIRKNRLLIKIETDGTVVINQGKISETEKYRQQITLGPEGKFYEHRQWDASNKEKYYEHIETQDAGDCTALIRMEGTYEVNVKGSIAMVASTQARFTGAMTAIGSKGNDLQKTPSNVSVEGLSFMVNTPIRGSMGIAS